MRHDVLGDLSPDGVSGDWTLTVRYGSRQVNVHIAPDDQAFETTLQLASEVVGRLDELDRVAKQVAVRNLRDMYNGGWNEFAEAQVTALGGVFPTRHCPRWNSRGSCR